MIDSQFDLDVDEDETGMHRAVCPFCEWVSVAFFGESCTDKIVKHMNEEHAGGRIGNA
jgi:hypothetical protein